MRETAFRGIYLGLVVLVGFSEGSPDASLWGRYWFAGRCLCKSDMRVSGRRLMAVRIGVQLQERVERGGNHWDGQLWVSTKSDLQVEEKSDQVGSVDTFQ